MALGKQALYLDGREGTLIKAKAIVAENGNWLAAVPAHGESAWSGKIVNGRFVAGSAEFRSLTYGFRSDSAALQDAAGFCADRADLVPQLKTALREAGFKEGEIHDFEIAWTSKIPLSRRYCVFPQTAAELQKIARVEIEPAPKTITRLAFVIQVEEGLTGKPAKFAHPPAQPWKPELASPETRMPAAEGLSVREWSVGFVVAPKTKN